MTRLSVAVLAVVVVGLAGCSSENPTEGKVEPVTKSAVSKKVAERKSSTKAPSKTSTLKVVEATMAKGVDNRIPMGKGTEFTADVGKLWAWIKVENTTKKATHIVMDWKRDGTSKNKSKLDIGAGKSWRTWSYMRVDEKRAGTWSVEIRDANAVLLQTLPFTVRGSEKSGSKKEPPRALK